MNPYILMTFLYAGMAAVGAITSSLTGMDWIPFFNGLRWLRVHYITLGILAQVIFGFLPVLVAGRMGKPSPRTRWDIWLSLNMGLLALLIGIPLNNAALIFAEGTLVFIAAILLLIQLIELPGGHLYSSIPHERANVAWKFYIAGLSYLLVGVIVGTGLFLGWDITLLHMASPKELHVHANNWGFLALVFAGLLVDLYPQFSRQTFAWPRLTDAIFGLLTLGALSLVIGPWAGYRLFSVIGVVLNFIGTVLLFLNVIIPLRYDRGVLTPGMVHLIAAYLWFFVLALTAPFIPEVEKNASQMLIYGWVLQFGYALIPYLFKSGISPSEPHRLNGNWLSVITVNVGVIFLWAGTLSITYQGLLSGIAYAFWALSLLPILVEFRNILKTMLARIGNASFPITDDMV